MENGTVKNVHKEEMKLISEENGNYIYESTLKLDNGGNLLLEYYQNMKC